MKLILFTYRALVLGALVLSILLQLALLGVADSIYKLVKIEAMILLQATAHEAPAAAKPPQTDLRVAER
jgi:hypothetical protein